MSCKIRSAVISLVLVNLFASAAYALPPMGRQAPSQTEDVLAAAWEWFAELLAPEAKETGVQGEKAGSQMDPDGNPGLVSGEMTDAGSSMDPDGNK